MSAAKLAETDVSVSMPQEPASIPTTSIQRPQLTSNQQQPTYSEAADQQQQRAEQQQTSNTNASTSSGPTNKNWANKKEKTPMCLINELARYNMIQPEYHLTGKQGVAHKKLFTVTLKLDKEEYKADGASIRKAQHSAAAIALQQTKFNHPPPKANQNNRSALRNRSEMELDALAMKHGEKVVYELESGAPAPQAQGNISRPRRKMYGRGQPRYNYNARHNNSAHYENRYYGKCKYQHLPRESYFIRLHVGEREYLGMGDTVQAARHDAASKAIEDIKQKEMDNQQCSLVNENELPQADICNKLNTELTSPVLLVHKIASKRNLNVIFEVLDEKGPPHKKVFLTQCRVGDLMTEGEGSSKKISKKRAAEKMVEESSKLGPLPNTTNLTMIKRKHVVNKKRRRNLIKDYTEEINPISYLIEIQQANREKKPIFNVIEEQGEPRSHKFVIQASFSGQSSTGVGPNKKTAKRNAAEALLALLGLIPQSTPKSVIKTKGKLRSLETLNSASGSASTEVKKPGQVQRPNKSPQVCHGKGPTTETLREKATLDAVTRLSELGLDDVTSNEGSNAASVHGRNTAKPQVVPKAGLKRNKRRSKKN